MQVVNVYEDEGEQAKQKIDGLLKSNEELEEKVIKLANQKYKVENQLIDKERQLYEHVRTNKRSNTSRVMTSFQIQPTIQAIQSNN